MTPMGRALFGRNPFNERVFVSALPHACQEARTLLPEPGDGPENDFARHIGSIPLPVNGLPREQDNTKNFPVLGGNLQDLPACFYPACLRPRAKQIQVQSLEH